MRTELVPATAEQLQAFRGQELERSVRAVAAVRDGQVLGVAGIYPGQAGWVMFAELSDDVRRDKRLVIRGYRAVQDLARRRPMPVVAIADPEIPGSDILLEHMGFQRVAPEVFLWHS
jgi:hypothetical protein